MEILNNTIIIPVMIDRESRTLSLKISGQTLFNLYKNGKRCVCRFDPSLQGIEGEVITFDIITALYAADSYAFMVIMPNRTERIIAKFTSLGALEEPSYEVEG